MKAILLACIGIELLPWIVVGLGALLIFGAVRLAVVNAAENRNHNRAMQASREREASYRADAENLEWLMAGNYEGQYATPTMYLTRPL